MEIGQGPNWGCSAKKKGISYKAPYYTVEGLSVETVLRNELVVYIVTLAVCTLYSADW
jgi:hypothetical protein